MAHSVTCRCRAVINRRSLRLNLQLFSWTGISRDMNFGHWRFSASVPCVWKPTWMYSDEMFYLYCTSCKPVFFLFKCFKFSLCWRSLYLSLLCGKKISREGREHSADWGETEGQWRTGSHTCQLSCSRWRTLHFTPQLLAGHSNTNTTLSPSSSSFSVWLSDHVKQWGLNLDSCRGFVFRPATLSGPLPAEWPVEEPTQTADRLPALSALKCSLTSHPDCEKLISRQPFSFSFCSLYAPWKEKKEKKEILPSDDFVWFRPALVSDCCLVCSATISYSACDSFSITFCCLKKKTDDVLQKTEPLKPGLTKRFTFFRGAAEKRCLLSRCGFGRI